MEKVKALFKKYKQALRGFLGWLFGIGVQIAQAGADQVMTWSVKRWVVGLAFAAIPGFVGLMKLGDPNPTPEEMYDAVHKVKMARAEANLEITDPSGMPLPKAGG
jgi:hypothetical protein